MLALIFNKKLELRNVPMPRIRRGEALVRVGLAGICNTDVEIVRGYMNFRGVLGHEFVGVVEKCADASWLGRRVVGEINAACGACAWCAAGLGRHCPNRTVLGIAGRDGAFAERVCLPIRNMRAVPESVPDGRAVFTEPLAAAFEILDQVRVRPDHRIAVLGDGKLGALVALTLATVSENVILLGKHKNKLERIRRNWPLRTDFTKNAPLVSYDIVVECSGAPAGLATATALVKPRGTLVLKSTCHGPVTFNTAPWVINEITIIGSRCGRFEPALDALASGRIDPLPLVDAVFPASSAVDAMNYAQQPGVFKTLIDFSRICRIALNREEKNIS